MISEKLRKAVRPTSILLTVIWAAEFSSFAVYYVVALFAANQDGPTVENAVLPVVIGAAGAMSLLGGIALRFFAFSQGRARKLLARPAAQPVPGGAAFENLDQDEQTLAAVAARSQQLFIIALAMVNSCGVFGLVLALVQRDPNLYLPFLVGGLVGCAFCFPRLYAYLEETQITMRHFRRKP